MNKLWMSASLLLVTAALTAQKADSVAQAQRQQEYLANYKRALLYDDMPSAAYALTGYLQNGGQDSYKDSLAIIYYRSGNLNGSYRLANESYTADNKNVTALTLLADITGRAGDNKASLDWYEKLSALAPSPYNYYQLATRQFILERVGECRQTLQKVVADSVKAKEEQVTLEIGQGQGENVPILAAAYNMLGALAYRDKKEAEAKAMYQKAIEAFPDFVIARQNLESLKKPAAPAAKAPAKGPKG